MLADVTFTLTVQVAPGARVAPASEIELLLATAVSVAPEQLVAAPEGLKTRSAAGKVSVNATPVSETVLAEGLPSVKAAVELALGAMVVGENVWAMVGLPTTTVASVPVSLPVFTSPPPETATELV